MVHIMAVQQSANCFIDRKHTRKAGNDIIS